MDQKEILFAANAMTNKDLVGELMRRVPDQLNIAQRAKYWERHEKIMKRRSVSMLTRTVAIYCLAIRTLAREGRWGSPEFAAQLKKEREAARKTKTSKRK